MPYSFLSIFSSLNEELIFLHWAIPVCPVVRVYTWKMQFCQQDDNSDHVADSAATIQLAMSVRPYSWEQLHFNLLCLYFHVADSAATIQLALSVCPCGWQCSNSTTCSDCMSMWLTAQLLYNLLWLYVIVHVGESSYSITCSVCTSM